MTQGDAEQGPKYPFEIKYSREADPTDLPIKFTFGRILSEVERSDVEEILTEWSQRAINEGYDGQFMHYLDDEFEWKARAAKSILDTYADMGSLEDQTLIKALDALFRKLTTLPLSRIKLGE